MSEPQADGHKLPLEAYKLLVGLLEHEEGLFWRRNEVMLVLNGGLVAILGVIQAPPQGTVAISSRLLSGMICAIGAVMSLLWLLIARRSEAFYNHWYEQLKFLERQYLSPISVFQIADEYFSKGRIQLGKEEFKLGFLSRRLRIYQALIAAPLVFLIAWIGLGLVLIFGI